MNGDQIRGTAKIGAVYNCEGGSAPIASQTRIGDLWCRLMHTEPMWPAHGRYECRTCGRQFPVCWEQPSTVASNGTIWPPETQAASQLAGSYSPLQ
jgi:hypothetical protein